MKDFKDRLTYLMGLNGISNYRLAKETGLSASTIANWLNGNTTPDSTKLDAVGLLLGCDVNWLATGIGDIPERKEEAVADRLKMLMFRLGYQISSFAKEIGTSNTLLQVMFERKSHISTSVLVGLSRAFPQVNIDWIITGKGEMLKSNTDVVSIVPNITEHSIPYYEDLPVSAGQLDVFMQNAEPSGWVNLPGVTSKALFPVVGCSMKPEINPGDVVGIVQLNSWDRVDPDKTYLIITTDDRMIKHLALDNEDDSILWCISPNYPKFKINKSDIKFVYRISFCGKLM